MAENTLRPMPPGNSIWRDHSPYCEATGPIVHEGFVAARIRDFQALQFDRSQMSSHSPMIPCPVPSWLQIYEPQSTPRPICIPSCCTSAVKISSVPSMKPKLDVRHADPDTESCPGSAWRYKTRRTVRLPEKDICCPRAIPPSLVLPPYEPYNSHREIDVMGTASERNQPIHPRRSIAEKLGLMVDSNWKGCGSLLDGDVEMSQLLRTYSTPEQIDDSKGNPKTLFGGHGLHSPLISERGNGSETYLGRPLESPEKMKCFDGDVKPNLRDFQSEKQFPCEEKATHGTRHAAGYEDSTTPVEVGSKDVLDGQSSARDRAKSLGNSQSSVTLPNKRLRTRSVSLSQLIDRHLTDWTALGIFQSRQPTTGRTAQAPAIGSGSQQFAPETDTLDSNQSRTMTQRSRQSSTRSASWFNKFPRLRIALVDKAPSTQKFLGSTEIQKASSQPKTLDNEQEGCRESIWQDEAGQCSITSTTSQTASMNGGHLHRVEPTSDMFAELLRAGDTPVTNEKIPCSQPASVSDEASPFSIQSNRDFNLPFQPQQCCSLEASSPHKSEDSKKTAKEQSTQGTLHGISRTAPVAELADDMKDPVLKESDANRSFERRPLSPTHVLTDSQSLRSQIFVSTTEGGATEFSRAVQWEASSRDQGIQRVQVIVSLDGSDDLLIEAKLFRQPKSK